MACKDDNGKKCPDTGYDKTCSPFQLTKINQKDACFIDNAVNEHLNIGGADVHVFKLLGIHEQGLLVDYTGKGTAISGGAPTAYPAANAFTSTPHQWRSLQKGNAVLESAFIGYDFGVIELDNGRARYGIDTSIRHHITSIKIKQSSVAANRATKARVERSGDGITWYGVAIVDLPDDDQENLIQFKESVPSRFWRLRPITFNGSSGDFWSVTKLQLFDLRQTKLTNLQDDLGFLESRDRDYSSQSELVKASYDLIDIQTELTRFGIDMPSQQFIFHVNFNACVQILGRPIVIGDIFELPSEIQYTPSLQPVKKYLEVTDVAWDTAGYTPGWEPTMQRIIAQPALASQETQDIFGDLAQVVDSSGLVTVDTDKYVDLTETDAKVQAAANAELPERGADPAGVAEIPQEQIDAAKAQGFDIGKVGLKAKGLYVEDALPPNGLPYTEGDTLPDVSSVSDGAYHRLTYSGMAGRIPPRLYRFSLAKNRWIYMETDRRYEFNPTKPVLQSFLNSPTKVNTDEIDK